MKKSNLEEPYKQMNFLPDLDLFYIIGIREGSFGFRSFGSGEKWHQHTVMMRYRSNATLCPVLQEKKTACLGDGCWKFEFFLCARKQALVCFGFYSFTHFCTEVDSSFNQFNYGRGSDFF